MTSSNNIQMTYIPMEQVPVKYSRTNVRNIYFAVFLLILPVGCWQPLLAQINRYPPITAHKTGVINPYSPDPIMNFTWDHPKAADELESYIVEPVSWDLSKPSSFNMKDFKRNGAIVVKGKGDIRFYFGQINAGWLEFDSPDIIDSVQMSISEYNQPPVYGSNYPQKTMVPVKHGNTYRLELNKELYEGVRFGWIHVRSFSAPWHISGVRLVCQTKPTNYNGSFSCSDTLLTRIWYTGAYTVKLNLLKDYFGAILMNRTDRFSWTGDAHPAQAASMVAFGNDDFVRKNLIYTSKHGNGIRSYELYWILSLIDYYTYTGDAATFRTYIDHACATLDGAYEVYGTNPDLGFYGWDERLGAGFEHPNTAEPENAYKMLSIRAWKAFAAAMGAYGRTDLQGKYNGYATEKMNALRKDPFWYKKFGLHAGADAVTTCLLNAVEKNAIYRQCFKDKINRISYSPFNQYFVIQAFAMMNKYDGAVGSIRDLWGGQIEYGGTSFFEVFRPSWNAVIGKNDPVPTAQCGFTSLCHPWGAGVTKWLSEEVLGIKPTSPGFATFDIVPHLGRTLTSVTGKTPTSKGEISASFNVSTGLCNISSPIGTVGRIGIPKVEKRIRSIKINGSLAWDDHGYHSISGFGAASEDAQFVYFTAVKPGQYKITVNYSGSTPRYTDAVAHYPAGCLGIDSVTKGDFGGVHGKDGYLLCNYEGNGESKASLPTYVSSIKFYKVKGNGLPLNLMLESKSNDHRALAPDPSNSFPRTAAGFYAMDEDQIGYSFTTDIALKESHDYTVSLYFLNWNRDKGAIEVEMFDGTTLNLITPVQVVKSSQGGVYITYHYKKSARFRINTGPGSKTVLSGIFFDPDSKNGLPGKSK